MDTNFHIADFSSVVIGESMYQGDVIEAISYTLRYLKLSLHIDNPYFGQMVQQL